ncbi:hypothetical protein O3M35_000688 [Rhynocoris fuscipes]|uniref:Uncharacterized protein n=1 Tax=Rhynocoris fuscipes TaxID=488301 RepID=A0AAW1DPD7_9HEMI
MLSEVEKAYIADLLQTLPSEDLIELAKRMTEGILKPSDRNDSINAILLHTPDIKTLLAKRKFTKAILFKYLHSKNVSFPGNAEKLVLIDLLLKYWERNAILHTQSQTNVSIGATSQAQVSNTSVATNSDDLGVKALAVKFVEWFYSRINASVIHLKTNESNNEEKLIEDDFWSDAKLAINVTGGSGEVIANYFAESSEECLKLISNSCAEHSIFFSPNLREDGTRGTTEPHGMILVMNCGTLHSTNGHRCVGLYEQVFGLIKDPVRDIWKIKMTKLNLRSQDVKSAPVLPESNQLLLCDM